MIPEKAIKKFTKPSHREIVAGILLAYGFFPNTTEGIDQAKKFVSGLDRWIAPSNLPEYYDNIESDLMTGKETPGILAIRQALSDFYFNNTQTSVEELPVEEIPVVVEVVEVEKQPEPQPDPEPEPVEIKVEVPVQSTPKLPKRIRLPRQKGRFVRRRQKSLAERMSAAFDKNLLDPLIEVIKNPPPGATPKTKKGVKSQKVVSKKKFTPPGVSGKSIATTSSSGGDLVDRAFSKISSAFKTAAAARKSFKESGGDPKTLRRRYFFDRALASEFGGDFLRRTRGTFSSAPDAKQDPGLSKGERFAAVVNRDLAARPQMMRQEELFDVDQYTDKTPLQSILDLAKKTADKINGIESGFVRIEKSNKETSEAFKKISSSLSEVKNVYVKTTNNFKEFIDNKEEVIKIKEKINNFKRKQTDEIKIEQKERQTELFDDVAGVSDVQEVDQGLDEENVEAKDKGNLLTDLLGGAGELLGDIPGKGLRLGARARLLRRKVSGFGRGIGDRLGGIGKGISDRLGGIGKGIKGIGAKIGTKTGTKIGSKVGGGLLKTIGKKIPGVGLILGTLFSIDRFKNGDILGGLGEIASGVASIFPGPGTAISLGIDALLMGRDVTKPETKLSSGGIVAGEAGNEAVIPLNTAPAKKAISNLKESSGGSLLGAVGPVLSAVAGIVRNPLYGAILGPTVNPILQPMMAKYKVPVYSADLGLFKASKLRSASTQAKGKSESMKKAGDNPATAAFGWLGNLFGGIGNAIGGAIGGIGNFFSRLFGGGKGKNRRNGGQNVRGIPLGEGETATGAILMSGLVKRGFTKEEAAAIVGNLWAESSFRTGAVNPKSGAFGLMQWAYERKDTLIRRASEMGKSPTDLEFQLDHIAWELRGGDAYETAQFRKAMSYGSDVPSKTRGFGYEVERASDSELRNSMSKRIGAAESVYRSNSSSGSTRGQTRSRQTNSPPTRSSSTAPDAVRTRDNRRAATPTPMSGEIASITGAEKAPVQPVAMSPELRDESMYGESVSMSIAYANNSQTIEQVTFVVNQKEESGLNIRDIQIMSLA